MGGALVRARVVTPVDAVVDAWGHDAVGVRPRGVRRPAFELMVHPQWQNKHIAHRLHDELLAGRSEERATILVREDNLSAQTAYARWGWQKVGKLQPYPDSPHFDALILPLPIASK